MSRLVQELIERIHASNTRCSLIVTGAGGSCITELLAVPGCSRTLIDAQVPYSEAASIDLLDYTPKSFVTGDVARALAQAAYRRATALIKTQENIVGIGVTGAIATHRERKGRDQAFISVWSSAHGVATYHLCMSKNLSRVAQESLVGRTVLLALASAAGVDSCTADDLLGIPLVTNQPAVEEALLEATLAVHTVAIPIDDAAPLGLLSLGADAVLFDRFGNLHVVGDVPPYSSEVYDDDRVHRLLYPGSFNPLHYGHLALAEAAAREVQLTLDESRGRPRRPVVMTYEIAVSRVQKADLTADQAQQVLSQFIDHGRRVALTSARLFTEKARLFPNHGFVVGYDTAVRVLDPQYYGMRREDMIEALLGIKARGCYFVVGGRLLGSTWHELCSDDLPDQALADMFICVPGSRFRVDMSSTELRNRAA